MLGLQVALVGKAVTAWGPELSPEKRAQFLVARGELRIGLDHLRHQARRRQVYRLDEKIARLIRRRSCQILRISRDRLSGRRVYDRAIRSILPGLNMSANQPLKCFEGSGSLRKPDAQERQLDLGI